MDNTLIIDVHIFLGSLYGGLIAGLFYDIYKTFRYFSKPSKWITYIGDLLFWIIMSLLFFYILVRVNWGEIRGYIILGFLIGVLIYKKIFSKFIYQACIRIGSILRKTLKKLGLTFIYPFSYVKKRVYRPIKKIKNIPIILFKEAKKYKKIISSKK